MGPETRLRTSSAATSLTCTVYRVIRLLRLDSSGPLYHLAVPDGTLDLVHESQIAAAAE
jgi:hypothetical protein